MSKPPPQRFETTQWSLVMMAADVETSKRQQALSWLCEQYWHPLYFFVRRRGASREEAQDATQDFFAQLLESDRLAHADPNRGRFRTFMLTAFRNFLINRHERASAQKRGGSWKRLNFDFEGAEAMYDGVAARSETPEEAFERRWTITVISRAVHALQSEFNSRGKLSQFECLAPYLTQPIDKQDYQQLAETLNMTTEAVKVMLHRLRRRLGSKIREEVRATVVNEEELEMELQAMLTALGRGER